MNKVLFVGSNPSRAAKDSSVAFGPETRSGKVLQDWIARAGIENAAQINVAQYQTEGNRPLNKAEIAEAATVLRDEIMKFYEQGYKIVALGNTAKEAIMECRSFLYFTMPHPSGRNRLLNDASYVEEKIEELKQYVGAFKLE